MKIVRVTTVGELDAIIPLAKNLRTITGIGKFISDAEHTAWMVFNLPKNEDFGIWYASDENGVVGYLIAEVSIRYLHREVNIVEAYMTKLDEKISDEMFNFLEKWAEDHQCQILSCYTNRPDAIARKYDFQIFGTVLMKHVGMP